MTVFWFWVSFYCQVAAEILSVFWLVAAMSSLGERELYNIRKFDGTNFNMWKEQIKDVLVQKKQLKPISGPTAKPADMSKEDSGSVGKVNDQVTPSRISLLHNGERDIMIQSVEETV